jgi:hypothetical protein
VALRLGAKYFLPAVGGHWGARKAAKAQNNIQKNILAIKYKIRFIKAYPSKYSCLWHTSSTLPVACLFNHY